MYTCVYIMDIITSILYLYIHLVYVQCQNKNE